MVQQSESLEEGGKRSGNVAGGDSIVEREGKGGGGNPEGLRVKGVVVERWERERKKGWCCKGTSSQQGC